MPVANDTFLSDGHAVDGEFESLEYSYAQNPATQLNAALGERKLWCAVIEQAFVDIGAIVPNTTASSDLPRSGREHDEAAYWLLSDRKDFPRVCMLAGVSSILVRRAAQAFYTLHRDMPH